MEQREKLIELIIESVNFVGSSRHWAEIIADHLIANGVIVLPCKVGDTVYKICPISNFLEVGDLWGGRIVKTDCDRCAYGYCDCHDIGFKKDAKNIVHEMKMRDIVQIIRDMPYFGTIYFLTKEEAEKALAKRKGGDD